MSVEAELSRRLHPIQGRGLGGPAPLYFWTKLTAARSKGRKKNLETASPPLSRGLDDRPPLSRGLDPALTYCLLLIFVDKMGRFKFFANTI